MNLPSPAPRWCERKAINGKETCVRAVKQRKCDSISMDRYEHEDDDELRKTMT